MRDFPALFSAPMVRANLADIKTQTRRPLYVLRKFSPTLCMDQRYPPGFDPLPPVGTCPTLSHWHKAKPGDRIWQREAFSGAHGLTGMPPRDWHPNEPIWYWADGEPTHGDWTKPKPSMHLPRCFCRFTGLIKQTRVERLHRISDDDAYAEGIEYRDGMYGIWLPDHRPLCTSHLSAADAYRCLWININGNGSWDANPWVVVIEYQRITEA